MRPGESNKEHRELRKFKGPIIGGFVRKSARSFLVLAVMLGCVFTGKGSDLKTLGLEYQLKETKDPRPNRAHVLRVDLTRENIELAVVVAPDPDGDGPAEAALTDPFQLASHPSVIAFVNTNPWDSFPDGTGTRIRAWYPGQPVDIEGLAVSGGLVRSPAQPPLAPIWTDPKGRVFFGEAPMPTLVEAMAGFEHILKDGTVLVPPGGAIHPRTALGINRDGTVMWLVVVDGRQAAYSEGMSLQELASLMLALGCWNATNMDGGGSSILGLKGEDGQLSCVNSPSDRVLGLRRIRPLPTILTIRKKLSPEPPSSGISAPPPTPTPKAP